MTLLPAHVLDWHSDRYGVQIYALDADRGQGWGVYTCTCATCGHVWQAVAAVGSYGRECPRCGDVDIAHRWGGEQP